MRKIRYPWDEWTDGRWHVARFNEDFTCSPVAFTQSLAVRRRATGLEMGFRTVSRAGVIAFRFHPATEDLFDRDPAQDGVPPLRSARGREPSYPWDEWTDGRAHVAIRNRDFTGTDRSFAKTLRQRAYATGRFVSIQVHPGGHPYHEYEPAVSFYFHDGVKLLDRELGNQLVPYRLPAS